MLTLDVRVVIVTAVRQTDPRSKEFCHLSSRERIGGLSVFLYETLRIYGYTFCPKKTEVKMFDVCILPDPCDSIT